MANTAQMTVKVGSSRPRRPGASDRGGDARSGTTRGAPGPGGSESRRGRRVGRIVTLCVAVSIVTLGILAAVNPYREYQDAEARLNEQRAQVALLEQENEALQAEVRRLQNPSYLEGLARRDLNLGRPGEEIFVVEGIPSGETAPAEEEPVDEPGPLERLIAKVRNLF